MKKIIVGLVTLCFLVGLSATSYAGMVDYNRLNKKRQGLASPAIQFQGVVVSKNIRNKQIAVKNIETGEQRTFFINDEDLLYSLFKDDEVQITYTSNSDEAKSVTVLAKR